MKRNRNHPLTPDLEPISLHDSRAGWKMVMNSQEISRACDRWLEKHDPAFDKKKKKFGSF